VKRGNQKRCEKENCAWQNLEASLLWRKSEEIFFMIKIWLNLEGRRLKPAKRQTRMSALRWRVARRAVIKPKPREVFDEATDF
jgi:hypothetical protein